MPKERAAPVSPLSEELTIKAYGSSRRVAIVGLGNLLLRDEGVGIQVIQRLEKGALPPRVELVDGATAGFDLIPLFRDYQGLVVVDALALDDEPGAIYRFTLEELEAMPQAPFTVHDISFVQAAALARSMGALPPVIILGIVPELLETGLDLSARVERRMPELMRLVLEEAGRLAQALAAGKYA